MPYEEEVEWIKSRVPDTLRAPRLFRCRQRFVTRLAESRVPRTRNRPRDGRCADRLHWSWGYRPCAALIAENTIPPWDGELTLKPVTSTEQVVDVVREAVALDADLIKSAVDTRGSMLLEGMLWWWDWQALETALVGEAAKHGLAVTTHAHALEYARGMIEAGAASLQHIPADLPVDEDFIDQALANDIIVVPTLAIRTRTFIELFSKAIDILPIEERCSVPGVIESWYEPLPDADAQTLRYRQQGEIAAANARALYDAGVTIAVATDAGMIGLAHGSSMHLELRALNAAGIAADYLIHAATLNSARVAGWTRNTAASRQASSPTS